MPRWGSGITANAATCVSLHEHVFFLFPSCVLELFASGWKIYRTSMSKVKRIAVIGAGPAGAISIDAFAQEQAFDVIRVFERRERPGGCW